MLDEQVPKNDPMKIKLNQYIDQMSNLGVKLSKVSVKMLSK